MKQVVDGPRACSESEFDDAISLVNEVFRAGTDQDIRTDYPLVFDPSRIEYMRILKVDGKVVAHVPVAPHEVVAAGDRFDIGIISPTVTHPDYRRRGYATLCLEDCHRIMEEQGMVVSVLWTMEATFPFYQNSGREAVGSQGRVYRLAAQDRDLFNEGSFEVVGFDPANAWHVDAIIKIHSREPYRIMRSRSDYRALFSLPKTSTFLAAKGEEVVAYLMIGKGANKPGLVEGGGDAEGLEALVSRALIELGSDSELQVPVPLTPSALGSLIEARKPGSGQPIEEAKGVGHQMMRVNSLGGLLRQISDYLRGKSARLHGDVCLVCSDTGEAVTLRFHDGDLYVSAERSSEQIVLTRRQLTQLIFGPHPVAAPFEPNGRAGELLQRIFPYYFPIWELDHS